MVLQRHGAVVEGTGCMPALLAGWALHEGGQHGLWVEHVERRVDSRWGAALEHHAAPSAASVRWLIPVGRQLSPAMKNPHSPRTRSIVLSGT